MTTPHIKRQTDVVIVGSGPGGASVARHLARAGTKVLLLERGKDYRRKPYYGTYLGAAGLRRSAQLALHQRGPEHRQAADAGRGNIDVLRLLRAPAGVAEGHGTTSIWTDTSTRSVRSWKSRRYHPSTAG